MNKNILAIFLIAVLLIVCAGAVSAADSQDGSNPISVKISWDDAAKVSERPSQVKVDLIKDGSVVDSAVLKESNSWKATFKAQGDGTFSVRASNIDDYSVSVGGSAGSGFVVTYSLKVDVLTASEDESAVQEDTSSDDVLADSENDESGDNVMAEAERDETGDDALAADEDETDDGGQDANVTDENDTAADGADEDNATDEDDNEAAADEEDDNDTATDGDETVKKSAPTADSQKTPVTKEKQTPKIVKKPIKKHKIAKSKLRKTGLPVAALVIMVGVAAFVPFSRKK